MVTREKRDPTRIRGSLLVNGLSFHCVWQVGTVQAMKWKRKGRRRKVIRWQIQSRKQGYRFEQQQQPAGRSYSPLPLSLCSDTLLRTQNQFPLSLPLSWMDIIYGIFQRGGDQLCCKFPPLHYFSLSGCPQGGVTPMHAAKSIHLVSVHIPYQKLRSSSTF